MAGKPLPLAALRAFDAVARHGSVSAAARDLSVTQPSVSEQLRLLEARIGARLFERTPAGLVPTPRGVALGREVGPAFAALRRALGAPEEGAKTLRLCLYPTLAARWLAGRLADLAREMPEVRLTITTATSWSPALLWENDVVARFGPGGWPGLRTVRVAEDRLVPVTAPGSGRERAARPPDQVRRAARGLGPVGGRNASRAGKHRMDRGGHEPAGDDARGSGCGGRRSAARLRGRGPRGGAPRTGRTCVEGGGTRLPPRLVGSISGGWAIPKLGCGHGRVGATPPVTGLRSAAEEVREVPASGRAAGPGCERCGWRRTSRPISRRYGRR